MTRNPFILYWLAPALSASCSCLYASEALPFIPSEPDIDAAVQQAIARNHLAQLSPNCLKLERSSEAETPYLEIYVREKHDAQCGGDPETAPLLFTVRIDRKNHAMSTDVNSEEGEFEPIK